MKDENDITRVSKQTEKTIKRSDTILNWTFIPAIIAGFVLLAAWFLKLAWLLFFKN